MKTILFQGDSITDAGRSKESDIFLGSGYANAVAGALGFERPNEFNFINRGIGGHRITNLITRVKKDFINVKPDYISILVGVNDVWHEIEEQNGVDTQRFEIYYNMLIDEIKEALPDTKIMILEPFVLLGSGTEKNYDLFRKDVKEKAAAAKRVAEKNNLLFVPLMDKFDELAKKAPSTYWLRDGVHPTAMGHELIKNEWLKAFSQLQ